MAAEAVGAAAAQRGVAPVVSAVDAGGELIYLVRPDAAQVASVEVTTDKARTAAIYRRPSKDFEDQASGGRPSALHLARAVPLQGGMPIEYDGEVVGAVGVSGASSADEDQELATIGVQAFAAALDGRQRPRHGGGLAMASTVSPIAVDSASACPGPPELLPGRPDAIVDLQTDDGRRARRRPVALRRRARRGDRLRRGRRRRRGRPARARRRPQPHLRRRARTPRRADFDDSGWQRARARRHACAGSRTGACASTGTAPRSRSPSASATSTRPARPSSSRSSSTTTPRSGSTASCRSRSATPAARSSAASTRPTASCSRATRGPGRRFQIAVFGINGPISASPRNYIWMRTATLDFYAARARAAA